MGAPRSFCREFLGVPPVSKCRNLFVSLARRRPVEQGDGKAALTPPRIIVSADLKAAVDDLYPCGCDSPAIRSYLANRSPPSILYQPDQGSGQRVQSTAEEDGKADGSTHAAVPSRIRSGRVHGSDRFGSHSPVVGDQRNVARNG
jgi:hypothetical protein